MTPTQQQPVVNPPERKFPVGKIIAIGCGVLLLLAAGIVLLAFFGVRHFVKSSDAYNAAVNAIKQSSNAQKALGEIVDIGFPSGSWASESGGSGEATLSMSITGSKAQGEYYATLHRRNGQWLLASGRVELSDGRSINIESRGLSSSGKSSAGAGRQLKDDYVDGSTWREVQWSEQHVRLRLPADWIEKTNSLRELDCRLGERYSSTYLTANAWIWDRELPAEGLLAADLQSAAERYRNRVILGYSTREVGGTPGVLTISDVGDRHVATWKSIVTVGGEQKSIDISFGALFRDFDRLEPTFNAILGTVTFQ